MLLDLRETVRNSKPIKYTLIGVIIVPFALFGIGPYLAGGEAAPAARVNGDEITQVELDAATQRQRRQLAQLFGGQLPESFADEATLRRQALDQLVTQRVLEEAVAEQRFAVGDATLGQAIRELPAFQLDGRFDAATYERQVRASGLSVAAFEQSFRDDTALEQFRTGLVDTSFTLPMEVERLTALARQTRTVDAVRYDLEKAKEAIVPTDEEIAAHFEENAASYVFPERSKIDWLELDSEALASGIDITDEQARARYEENRASYVRPEQREASHILLSLDADASDDDVAEKRAALERVRERLDAGETFADLAREVSEDIGSAESGGSLGVIVPGAMVAEFEETAFALESEGDVSEPVRTDFGLHLIRLDKVTPESGQPFEEVRDEIVATMRSEQADRDFFELRAELAELVFDDSDSLAPAAEATGLEVQSSDWLDADTIAEAGPVLSDPAILAAVNDPEVREAGNNSELIEIGPRHVVALRVTESEGPRPKALDDVRDRVVDEIKAARAGERLDDLADTAREALASGGDAAALAAEADAVGIAEALSDESLERRSTLFDGDVVAAIFALPRPADGTPRVDGATLADGDRLVYALRAVETPSDEPAAGGEDGAQGVASTDIASGADQGGDQGGDQGIDSGADPRRGGVEFEALLGSLRARADVELEP